MKGPSVTTGLPLSKRTVVAVRSGCSWCPPRTLLPCFSNHWSTRAISAPRFASDMASHSRSPSLVPVKSITYFIRRFLLILLAALPLHTLRRTALARIDTGFTSPRACFRVFSNNQPGWHQGGRNGDAGAIGRNLGEPGGGLETLV